MKTQVREYFRNLKILQAFNFSLDKWSKKSLPEELAIYTGTYLNEYKKTDEFCQVHQGLISKRINEAHTRVGILIGGIAIGVCVAPVFTVSILSSFLVINNIIEPFLIHFPAHTNLLANLPLENRKSMLYGGCSLITMLGICTSALWLFGDMNIIPAIATKGVCCGLIINSCIVFTKLADSLTSKPFLSWGEQALQTLKTDLTICFEERRAS